MKATIYLIACGLIESFGLNPEKYAAEMREGFVSSNSVETVSAFGERVLFDGIEKVIASTGRPYHREGRTMSIPGVHVSERDSLVNSLNHQLLEHFYDIDPHFEMDAIRALHFVSVDDETVYFTETIHLTE